MNPVVRILEGSINGTGWAGGEKEGKKRGNRRKDHEHWPHESEKELSTFLIAWLR